MKEYKVRNIFADIGCFREILSPENVQKKFLEKY